MNAYNQDKLRTHALSRYNLEGKDDPFRLLVKKYLSDVEDVLIDILQSSKNMSEKDANDFADNLFSLDDKRQKDIAIEVEDCYKNGKTKKECAQQIIHKYYRITKNNKYINKAEYQTNRDLSGEGEITEVDERIHYKEFHRVAKSMFWNFIYRINDLNLKFILNTTFVKNVPNSLNNNTGYVLYMETSKINNREVEYEFKHSKTLSNILTYIMGKDSPNEITFYIGMDNSSELHFGFIINNKRHKIGYVDYNSYDFKKLVPYIETTDKEIDLIKLSRKFISNVESIGNITKMMKLYFYKYEEEIEIYSTIINNYFSIVVETTNDDIINKSYIEEMVSKYGKLSHHTQWTIEQMRRKNKTIYYFILK